MSVLDPALYQAAIGELREMMPDCTDRAQKATAQAERCLTDGPMYQSEGMRPAAYREVAATENHYRNAVGDGIDDLHCRVRR